MTSAVPIKETKDTAKFSKMVHDSGRITVTKNGYDDYVAMTTEEYDSLRYRASMAGLYEKLLASERDMAEGRVSAFDDFREDMKRRYGL